MTAVRGTAQHHVAAADPAREQDTVAVEGEKGVFQLGKGLEIKGIRNADGRLPAVGVAPGHIVSVLDPHHARIVAVLEILDLTVGFDKRDAFLIDLPVNAVFGKSGMKLHIPRLVIHAEHAGEAALKRHDCAVEDGIGAFQMIAADHRVCFVAPDNIFASLRFFLPRDVRNGNPIDNLCFHI